MAASKSKQKSYIAGFKDISRLTADDFLRVWEHYDADGKIDQNFSIVSSFTPVILA